MKKLVFVLLVISAAAAYAQEATPEVTPEATPEVTPDAPVEMIELPAVDPIDVSGDIRIAGSSTVFPLTEQMIQRFEEDGYTDTISDESIGTSAGFERLCVAGDIDIANASRTIREREVEQCAQIGREPIALRIGTDALVVAVSVENTFLDNLTLEELALVFSTAETWQDVRAGFPDEPILRHVPGTESGTFDFFVEQVFDEETAPLLAASNLQLSEDDRVLVRQIEANPHAVGFFGFAYYLENRDRLRSIAIEGVQPNEITAEDGTYILSRPLFLYTDAGVIADRPQVGAFLIYYLNHVNEEILDVGYFPASDEALNEARAALLSALEQ